MATKIKCARASGKAKMAGPVTQAKVGDPPPDSLLLLDTEQGGFTLFGVNKAGNRVGLDGIATLTPAPTSSDTAVLTVGAPTGLHVPCVAVAAGVATVSATVAANDGSFSYALDIAGTVKTDPGVSGLVAVFDAPVSK